MNVFRPETLQALIGLQRAQQTANRQPIGYLRNNAPEIGMANLFKNLVYPTVRYVSKVEGAVPEYQTEKKAPEKKAPEKKETKKSTTPTLADSISDINAATILDNIDFSKTAPKSTAVSETAEQPINPADPANKALAEFTEMVKKTIKDGDPPARDVFFNGEKKEETKTIGSEEKNRRVTDEEIRRSSAEMQARYAAYKFGLNADDLVAEVRENNWEYPEWMKSHLDIEREPELEELADFYIKGLEKSLNEGAKIDKPEASLSIDFNAPENATLAQLYSSVSDNDISEIEQHVASMGLPPEQQREMLEMMLGVINEVV